MREGGREVILMILTIYIFCFLKENPYQTQVIIQSKVFKYIIKLVLKCFNIMYI